MVSLKTLSYLGIVGLSAALVAMGAHEFKQKHDLQRPQIQVENVQRMLKNFRGVSDVERASFSASQYQQLKLAQPVNEQPDSLESTVSDLKLRFKKAIAVFRADSPAQPEPVEQNP